MKIKNKQSILALLIVVVLGVVGGTYAYFQTYTSVKNEFKTGTYSVAVTEQFVSPEAWTPGTVTPKVVNITNEGTVAIALRAKFIEEWTAVDGTTKLTGIRNGERVAQFDINEDWKKSIDGYYYYLGTVEPGNTSPNVIESVTYNPNFYLEEGLDMECTDISDSNGNIQQSCKNLNTGYAGATYKLTIIIETIQIDQKWDYLPSTTLYKTIADQAVMDNISSKYVSNSTGIDFSKSSGITNGQGIYTLSETASESCPVHYFRGNVANNHVIFAGHCWEIVRTTETCGVKLVYNGEPTGGKCLASGSEQNLTKTIFNDSINSLAYQGYMYNKVYEMDFKDMSSISSEIKYGNSFMYSNGSYELTDTITYNSWSDAHNNLNNNHYTCFNSTGTCDSLYYIFYTNSTNAFYVELKDGADIQTALNEMLYASDVNAKDSDIKKYLEDTWFTDKKTGVHYYSRFLEDTKWCNDRQIASLGGWNPNGGSTSETLTFKGYDRLKNTYKPTLKCEEQDAFTLSLDKGGTEGYGNNKLTYPVGMLTADEYVLAGSSTTQTNTDYYLYTSTFVWTLTPSQVLADQYFIRKYNLDSGGGMGVNGISIHEYFIRPSISLIKGTEFESGDGTKENPYVIVVD